jgi:L-threonylcarbamoyladenylate synthase
MKTELLRADHPIAFKHAVDVLKNGGLVAFPTDTVYGLATMLTDEEAVERLYIAKGRSNERAIAVLIGRIADLDQFVGSLPTPADWLIQRFWPGPLTLVLQGLPNLPENLAPGGQVGVRMPKHPVALRLLLEVGPLAVTSANLTGRPFAATAQQVLEQLQGRIHLVLDGGTIADSIPSTIVDLTSENPEVVREGAISRQEILVVINR